MFRVRQEKTGFVTENVGCCGGCGRDIAGGQSCVCDKMTEKNKANEKPTQ